MTSAAEILAAISAVDRKHLPALLAAIAARLVEPAGDIVDDELVDAQEAATMLGVSASYLYHAEKLPFAVKGLGRRRMFSRVGIQKFIAKNTGKD